MREKFDIIPTIRINHSIFVYRAATVFVGLAVIVGILSVIALLLFCFMKSGTVFEVCGVMQLLTGKILIFDILFFAVTYHSDQTSMKIFNFFSIIKFQAINYNRFLLMKDHFIISTTVITILLCKRQHSNKPL